MEIRKMRKGSNKSARSSKGSVKNDNAEPNGGISPNAEAETEMPEGLLPQESSRLLLSNAISAEMENEGEIIPGPEPPLTKIQGSAHEGTGTSISSQIQKIIAKELMAPGNKRNIDLQSIPMKEYLEHTVLPIVHQGLTALARERPESPIEYLAAYFLKHKNKYQLQFSEQLQQQIQPQSQSQIQNVQQLQESQPQMDKTPRRNSTDQNQNQLLTEN